MPDPASDSPSPMPPGRRLPWRRLVVGLLVLGAFAGLYLFLAGKLMFYVNATEADVLGADQKHNMKLALMARDFRADPSLPWWRRALPHYTDGVVNPLWPWVASSVAGPGDTITGPAEVTAADRAFFERGRWLNAGIGLGFCLALGAACLRRMSLPAAINVLLLAGLGAFLPRSAYFQPEPLYFAFFLGAWVCGLLLLLENRIWLYAAFGAFAGLAYLAKTSIQPLVAAFWAVAAFRLIWEGISRLALRRGKAVPGSRFHPARCAVGFLLFAAVFVSVASPRFAYSLGRFGSATHTYPAYWMWMDDFPECYAWMGAHGTKESLAAIEGEDRPGAAKYFREHSGGEAWARLADGTWQKVSRFAAPPRTRQSATKPKPWKEVLEWRGAYLGGLGLALVAALGGAALWRRSSGGGAPPLLHPEWRAAAIFCFGAFALYALSYGWYSPIGRGDRFMLSLYAPLAFTLAFAGESVLLALRERGGSGKFRAPYLAVQWMLAAALLWRCAELLRHPVFAS